MPLCHSSISTDISAVLAQKRGRHLCQPLFFCQSFQGNFLGYQYLKLRASRYPSHRFATGPSRSQAHGRPWFPIPIPQKVSLANQSFIISESSSISGVCGLPRIAAMIFFSSSSASSGLSCITCLAASRPCARRVSP